MRCFWHTLYLFLFQGESLFLIGWSLWSCLDCIQVLHCVLYLFSSCHFVFTLFGLFMLRGVYFVFLVLNFLLIYDYEFFIVICIYYVLFEIKIFIFLYLYFFHTCGYAFYLSVSRNIQVDSIKLLSTIATDGQQLELNLCL